MITDNFHGLETDSSDVCIIGAGPVGISLAVRLAELGISVLMLESGGLNEDPKVQALGAAEIDDLAAHDAMEIAVSRRLGGTSNLWGGRCLPFDPVDFLPRTELVGATWPIPYEAVQPFYAKACEYTDSGPSDFVEPATGIPPTPEEFELDRLERWSGTPRLQRLHDQTLATHPRIDVRLNSTVVDLVFAPDGAVSAVKIVRTDGSQSVTVGVRRLVIATGGVEATRFLLAIQQRRPEMFGGRNGALGRYYMGHVTGTVADITFTNRALDNLFNFDTAENGVYIRRRFTPTTECQLDHDIMNSALWPVVPPISDAAHGSGPLSAIFLGLAWGPMGRWFIPEALRKAHVPNPTPPLGPHMLNVLGNLPATLPYMVNFFQKRYFSKKRIPGFYLRNPQMRYGLYYHSEQWPNPDSRITLNGKTDRLGLPSVRIDLRFDERDARSVLKTHDLFEDWLNQSGLGVLRHRYAADRRAAAVLAQASHGTHQIGTTRMASSKEYGVVDSDLRTFSVKNLFVAAASSLPTSGQANPTLTVIALALRLAETLARECRGEIQPVDFLGRDGARTGSLVELDSEAAARRVA